ncbi:DsbC family protein [Mangrovimicrobium sediminis]|uniref:Thiol:disulfide interchange protein n=1 Tax=Mangrovimicrobium sediminis TaxID=2562682 RepID=A0A4Z0M9E3_9GAMM|nr:DsbC family protein [Haliea sp. SAOS-164]TGD76104.1 DsbC family protein [Haliea sp. SAOS-164]
MISRISRTVITLVLSLAAAAAGAQDKAVDKAVLERLTAALNSKAMGLKVGTVERSEIPGIYAVQFDNGPLVYATEDGSYFIHGDLFAVNKGDYVNLSERRRDTDRKDQLAQVDEADMIIFKPEGEPRAVLSVFTDTSCFYCQKLHKEVPELNKRGVEVRYLAFPRAGVGSAAYSHMVTAWCSENRQEALTKLKNKQSVPAVECADNPVIAEYELGQRLGVRGTPALITETGQLIPGYQTVDQLMVTLGLE